ncbi:hypothetical protein FSARC_12557 [Fusarium sarcochroum]|uniref:BZIP domain-containing protein n=1 Tax=Fusarium sarcochroum TaxID=1208366 RepID=A0A8H4T7L3_9HYPO|nr:hypothetical protein FSARC_12557 [Fusarium sarcochroum]
MGRNIFRVFNPGEPKPDPKEKRRAQLRQAQQTYRDRKDKYTKGLENELARARANEAQLAKDCDNLRSLLWSALDILSHQGTDLTPGLSQYANFAQNHRLGTQKAPSAIGPTPISQQSPFSTVSSISAGYTVDASPEYLVSGPSSSPGQFSPYHQSASPPGATTFPNTQPDTVAIGMDFVLKIEEPCLDHIHGDPSKPDEPNWHTLTATSQILDISGSPAPSGNTPTVSPPDIDSCQAILDRLSSLAPIFTKEGQITPIQAWTGIQKWRHFGEISAHAWCLLASRLKETAVCHGFGAVIEQSVFDQMVNQALELQRLSSQ